MESANILSLIAYLHGKFLEVYNITCLSMKFTVSTGKYCFNRATNESIAAFFLGIVNCCFLQSFLSVPVPFTLTSFSVVCHRLGFALKLKANLVRYQQVVQFSLQKFSSWLTSLI